MTVTQRIPHAVAAFPAPPLELQLAPLEKLPKRGGGEREQVASADKLKLQHSSGPVVVYDHADEDGDPFGFEGAERALRAAFGFKGGSRLVRHARPNKVAPTFSSRSLSSSSVSSNSSEYKNLRGTSHPVQDAIPKREQTAVSTNVNLSRLTTLELLEFLPARRSKQSLCTSITFFDPLAYWHSFPGYNEERDSDTDERSASTITTKVTSRF